MTAPDPSRKLAALLRRLKGEHPAVAHTPLEAEGHDPLVLEFMYSFLAWEAGPAKAEPALRRLLAAVVDYNELRVCLAEEMAAFVGERYPRARERMARLKSALNDLYRREHAVHLKPLLVLPKRDARQYVESLDGVPGFVAARVALLCLDGHAFPADDRITAALREEQAAPPEGGADEVSSWLERQVHSGEAREAYLLVEAWLAARAPKPRATERGAVKKPGKSSGGSRKATR
ncbi:MAG: hypothetical protein ACKVU4_11490 [Phycisphaerales bacterium]